jgi:hypothetical protein
MTCVGFFVTVGSSSYQTQLLLLSSCEVSCKQMDVKAVSAALNRYINAHRTELARVPIIQSQLLELGALVLTAEHYKINGYEIRVSNLVDSKFRVKRTSGGKPWNFSWFVAARGRHRVEIHSNLPVAGFYGKDGARYVVDVAVCKPDFLPIKPDVRRAWRSADNEVLVTFVEAKKLTIYPMLLAQFIGIEGYSGRPVEVQADDC